METFFLKLLNLSITAGWLVLAVLLMRLVFRKAPKWVFCLLWGLVALRLICPISIESALSLIPSAEPLPQDIIYTSAPRIQSGVGVIDDIVNPVLSGSIDPTPAANAAPSQLWSFLAWIWAAGAAAMLLYALISYLLLRRRVATATLLRENIRQSEKAASPFVLGFFRPVIYLPYNIADADISYVIAHEQAHIRRKDHWWKPAGFVLLSVYWFHPLLWAAYVLLCRDIETACDEKVIRNMEKEELRAYSAALLHCSIRHKMIAACPLAFGETGVMSRIKSVMNYKKPAFWIVLLAVAATIIAAVCLLTVPKRDTYDSKTANTPATAVRWFDYTDTPSQMKSGLTMELPVFPGVTFRYDKTYFGNEITAEKENGDVMSLINGIPIWNAYFYDVTGDGVPELCATFSFGSGIIDTRIVCYDYQNGASYEMSDRGVYNYSLRFNEADEQLYVDKQDNSSTPISTGRLAFRDGSLQILWPEGDVSGTARLTAGTAYVSWQCLYMNPLSSYIAAADSGYRYAIEKDSFCIINMRGKSNVTADTEVDYGDSRFKEKIQVSRWEWQEFPYTDEEWKRLFMFHAERSEPIADIHTLYGTILCQPLDDLHFLLLADGDLLIVELKENTQMGKYIWSIYSLINETAMGVAQWEYSPLSSSLPAFRIAFDLEYTELSAICTRGNLVDFDSQSATQAAPFDTAMTLPKGKALYWSPFGEADGIKLASDTAIDFICTRENGSQLSGTIYITAGGSSDGRTIYTAALVGTGLHLSPNTETGGGIISLLTMDAEPEAEVTEYDLRDGKLELSPIELSQYVFFTNSSKIVVTVKRDDDFEGTVILRDISQNNDEIGRKDVSRKDRKAVFTNLTAARLYRIVCDDTENCTVVVSQE